LRPSRRDIVIATRRSRLATTQSQSIGDRLHRLNSRVELTLLPLESDGDRVLDHPLSSVGGKGLFTRAIERALLEKRADIAVHSLKDVPVDDATPGLIIAATPPRMPVHDVLIARTAARIDDLPHGARVGTCSPRRASQLLRLRSDLQIVPLRGNVESRIAKVLETGEFDATLLAAAGLARLGLTEHTNAIPLEQVLSAAGQGALAVQVRVDDHVSLRRCMPINDAATAVATNTERQVVAALDADCHSPIAVLAELTDNQTMRLRARVLSPDGADCAEADESAPAQSAAKLCKSVIDALLKQGAREILRQATRAAR